MDQEPLHRGFAEFVGTFAVVFAAVGALLVTPILFAQFYAPTAGPTGPLFASGLSLVAVALAYGLTYAIMISAVGPEPVAVCSPLTSSLESVVCE